MLLLLTAERLENWHFKAWMLLYCVTSI